MDSHFLVVDKEKRSKRSKGLKVALVWARKFLPVFLLFLILPFFMVLTMNPPDLRFFSGASEEGGELRVWLEPSSVVIDSGTSVRLDLMAEFRADESLNQLKVKLVPDGALSLDSTELEYVKPFRGKVVVGSVEVTALKSGSYEVVIPNEGVTLDGVSGKVEITGGSARVVSR